MYQGFSERLKQLRSRNKAALALGYGLLDSSPAAQKAAVTVIVKGLAHNISKRDVLLASHVHGIELDGHIQEQRAVIVNEYEDVERKREQGKADKKAEAAKIKQEREEFERWKATRKPEKKDDPPPTDLNS